MSRTSAYRHGAQRARQPQKQWIYIATLPKEGAWPYKPRTIDLCLCGCTNMPGLPAGLQHSLRFGQRVPPAPSSPSSRPAWTRKVAEPESPHRVWCSWCWCRHSFNPSPAKLRRIARAEHRQRTSGTDAARRARHRARIHARATGLNIVCV